MSTGNEVKGMVLHCDGGARPNPGFGGYGIHGYIYVAKAPTKGIGRNFEVTAFGYLNKGESSPFPKDADAEKIREELRSAAPIPVTALVYVDITGAMEGIATNNTGEIVAMTRALQYAAKHDIEFLQIYTDSEYTKNGATQWIDSWVQNNWIKSDGNPVSNADLWKALQVARDAVKAKGVELRIDWVRGHDGHVGNEKADVLASMGVFDAQRGMVGDTVNESSAEDYWKNQSIRHPFIAHRRCYFSSQSSIAPGVYHLGDHGKDDELLGKRSSDGCYSVVQLAEPDQVLEMLRKYQSNLTGASNSIFSLYLDQIYGKDMYDHLDQYREKAFEPPAGYRLDLKHANKTPLAREFKPARLAARSIEELTNLELLLEKFKEGSPDIYSTDITEYFFDKVEKEQKPKKGQEKGLVEITTKLKSAITVGMTHMAVKGKVPLGNGECLEEIKLTMGIDVLDRNSLKRLESMNPKVYLVTWSVSDVAYRYATIINAAGSSGIWCGVYSNLRLVTKKAE